MTRRTTTTATATMNHADLLAEYNRLSPTKRNALFKSKEEALQRINALIVPAVVPADTAPAVSEEEKAYDEQQRREEVEDTPPVEVTAKKSTTKKSAKKAAAAPAPMLLTVGRDPKDVRGRGVDAKIKLLVDAYPRKHGTAAHAHFQAMARAATVGEYLAMFDKDAQKTARQWMWNFKNYGFVQLED